ncbi:MAG: nucleotidyltransferase family protein [Anaerolineae bacterium]|nr:nucleotidyltransferase family protein [Anaerolineae bacterium]
MSEQGLGISLIIGEQREAILALAARYGASNVRIFGSVARPEARRESDMDILARFDKPYSIFDLVGSWFDLTELLGRPVSLVTDDTLVQKGNARFRENVLRDAVPL